MYVIADVHLHNFRLFGGKTRTGVNRRARAILRSLSAAIDCVPQDETLVVAGDLFDVKQPDPALVAHAADLLGRRRTILLLGNHEQLPAGDLWDNALSYLSHAFDCIVRAELRVVDGISVLFLPFRRGCTAEALRAEAASLCGADRPAHLVVGHVGVYSGSRDALQAGRADYLPVQEFAAVAQRCGAHVVLLGHEHVHRRWCYQAVTVASIGALCPRGFADTGGDYGSVFAVVRQAGRGLLCVRQEVRGPRFYTELPLGGARHTGHPGFYRLASAPSAATVRRLGRAGARWEVVPLAHPQMTLEVPQGVVDVEKALRAACAEIEDAGTRQVVQDRALTLWREADAR